MYTKEQQDALNEFYTKYATNPTNTQKLNILILELGDCNVSYMGMSADDHEQPEKIKIQVMEFEYLHRHQLYVDDFY